MEKSLDQLQQELTEDQQITLIGLQAQIANNPLLYQKWVNYHQQVKFLIKQAENQKALLLKQKFDYYTGRGDEPCMQVYEKSELKFVLSADVDLQKAESKLYVLQLKADLIYSALETIKQKGFALKGIQEQQRFEAGEFK